MLKDKIEKQYGSINKFIDEKLIELGGRLPYTRAHLYRVISHDVANPGIKTLEALSKLANVSIEEIVHEWMDEE